MHRSRLILGLLVAVLGLACVTINVYFPEAAIKDLSEKIEEAVARQAAEQAADALPSGGDTPAVEDQSSRLLDVVSWAVGTALRLTASPVEAQSVAAPEVSNPAIRRIIDSRAARLGELNGYKRRGALGEDNRALVAVRDLNALSLQERAAAQRLLRDENGDRERMFREIAAATGTDLGQLDRIRTTYAATLRQVAAPGDWIQMPDGAWRQK